MHRTIVIEKITNKKCRDMKVGDTRMEEYYMKTYKVKVDPNLPVIKGHIEGCYYPMDVLIVCPNQRVPMEKLDENVRRTMIAVCFYLVYYFFYLLHFQGTAVPPDVRFARIRDEILKAFIAPANKLMIAFGIKISTTMLQIDVFNRHAPQVLGGKNQPLSVCPVVFSLLKFKF